MSTLENLKKDEQLSVKLSHSLENLKANEASYVQKIKMVERSLEQANAANHLLRDKIKLYERSWMQ